MNAIELYESLRVTRESVERESEYDTQQMIDTRHTQYVHTVLTLRVTRESVERVRTVTSERTRENKNAMKSKTQRRFL